MKFGFSIERLLLSGPGVSTAEISFKRGLNVVAGPSDTGKTFIAQCIDFAFGDRVPPKSIPEANGYTTVALTIQSSQNERSFTLERSLRGGNVRLTAPGEPARILKARHQGDAHETLSAFLLELSGLTGKRVRTNQRGTTRDLSFRDLARLILVDEESVISAQSPVLSGQFTTQTTEQNVFRLLLTGVDDASVVALEDPRMSRSKQLGKIEVVNLLLERARSERNRRNFDGASGSAREQLTALEGAVAVALGELAAEQDNVNALEAGRRDSWQHLREVESRGDVFLELQKRFGLLRHQYESDLRRLEAISEASFRLEQMREERCPVCGALAEHHSVEHRRANAAPADVAQASRAEAEKTRALLIELERTMVANEAEVEALITKRIERESELESSTNRLMTVLQPRLLAAAGRLQALHEQRDDLQSVVVLLEREEELAGLLADIAVPSAQVAADFTGAVASSEGEVFAKTVEALLRAWQFPNLDRVTFSEDSFDVTISGRPRGSHGKGVRAITRAAFNLALLKLCSSADKPFPGLVLIDSPLVVYREPDAEEGTFPLNVKDAFYRSLATDFLDSQVIVLENDAPPQDLAASANVVSFTGADRGRRGFIPE